MSDFITVTPELMAGFLDEAPEYLSILDEGLMAFEQVAGDGGVLSLDDPADQERMNEMFRAAHSLKGLAAALGFDKIRDLTHLMETLFDQIRMHQRDLDPTAIETLFKVFDNLRDLVAELTSETDEPVTIDEAITALEAILKTPTKAEQAESPAAAAPPDPTATSAQPAAEPQSSPTDLPVADENQKILQDDPELAKLFVESTIETLDDLNQGLLKLEESPENIEVLNEIFRCAHNVKGACGAAGFPGPHQLTHDMETVLDRLRNEQLQIEDSLMNALFSSVDKLRACVESMKTGGFGDVDFADGDSPFSNWLESDKNQTSAGQPTDTPTASADASLDEDVLAVRVEFPDDFLESEIQSYLIHNKLKDCGNVVNVDPDLDSLDGNGTIENITFSVQSDINAEEIKKLVEAFNVKSVTVTGGGDDSEQPQAESSAQPEQSVAETQAESARVATPESTAASATPAASSGPAVQKPEPAPQQPAKPAASKPQATAKPQAPAKQQSTAKAPAAKPSETIRVDLDRLDQLMNLGGELVINKARFVQVHAQLESVFASKNLGYLVDDMSERFNKLTDKVAGSEENGVQLSTGKDLADTAHQLSDDFEQVKLLLNRVHESRSAMNVFSEALHSLNLISEGIQKRIMETRMVSIGPLFHRFRRVVRDIAKATNKRVELVLHGEATELDKRMIDELGDPITHMVRNSVDHGIESPEERIAAGKPPVATVELDAYHRGRHICIEIRDDGKGVDVERVKQKIIDREMATAKQVEQMTHKEIVQHIFKPGFSTAEQVTDLSGRGMGMDIVQSKIDTINGSVDVDSEPGQGTTVTIQLPLTLAIINALLCRIGEGTYAVPLEMVAEILTVRNEDIQHVQKSKVIVVRDRVIPLARIEHIFDTGHEELTTDQSDASDMTVIVLSFQNEVLGLIVDDLIGQEDVVIKNLAANFRNVDGIAGASIMGDGSVSLILDVAATMQMYVTREQQRREADGGVEHVDAEPEPEMAGTATSC